MSRQDRGDIRFALARLRQQGRANLARNIEGRMEDPEAARTLCRIALGVRQLLPMGVEDYDVHRIYWIVECLWEEYGERILLGEAA